MINEKKYLILLVLLAGIILLAPATIRLLDHNNHMINSEAYNNIKLYNQGDIKYDSLQGHNIPFNILNLIRLNDTARQILFNIIPILLGLVSIVLIYLVLHKQNVSEKTIIAIILLIIVSPIFSYTFTNYKIYSFIIFLNILGIYFLMNDKFMFSSAAFVIIPFIDPFSGLATIALLLIYLLSHQKHHTSTKITIMALSAAVLLSLILNVFYGYKLLNLFIFNIHNILTDIGANIGISFSIIILTIIGLILLWEDGWKTLVTHTALLFLFALALFNDTIRIYMNFIMMMYVGFAFMYLNRRKWSIAIIKKTTILLIICSIFFSTLVYNTKLIQSEPSPAYVEALKFIKNQSLPTEVILGSPGNGYMIEYYTDRMVFLDNSRKIYNPKIYSDLEIIATSRNLERTEKLLKEYNLKYILIDKEFKQYLSEKEGLLFIIETSNKFTSIYKNENIEVWMYTGDTVINNT